MQAMVNRFLLRRTIFAAALSILAYGAAATSATALELSKPLPPPDAVAGIEGRSVTFPSHSPFSLADVGEGKSRDPATMAQGTLYLPKGASARRPAPAVILLHGASGVSDAREHTYARQLAARGVAALVVDVFAARRDRAYGFVNRLLEITESMSLADAYAGLRFLGAQPEVDGRRVALIGFSYGGMVTTYAAYRQVAQLYARNGERFVGHIAYYAPCIANFRDNRATGAPLLMMYGGKDEIIDPKRCAEVASQLRKGGAEVRIVAYPNAFHKWDGAWGGPYRIGRSLASCRFTVGRDGTIRDGRLGIPMVSSFTRKMILALCADTNGYLIGRDDKVREKSNRELISFLRRVFAPGG